MEQNVSSSSCIKLGVGNLQSCVCLGTFSSLSYKDVTDLFGTDLPVEGGKGGEFAWRDGPLLAALKAGHWIVLDEVSSCSALTKRTGHLQQP